MSDRPALNTLTTVKGRFARSVRLDNDDREAQLHGYLPTARSLEVVRRVVRGMADPHAGSRAFSITGPYGSGKSSLAVFLDALTRDTRSNAHKAARRLLDEHDPHTAALLDDARAAMGATATGFARAVITAPQREPITATVLRALQRAAESVRTTKALRSDIAKALHRAESPKLGSPSYGEVHDLMAQVTAKRPLLLVIDEFGKNLEAFADSGADGDMYLLQELAEWATNGDLPLVIVTIQHLAFEAYAADASVAKRREWAKVQGRFEDIPFVDSAAATRTLISVALDHADDPDYTKLRYEAADGARHLAEMRNLAEVTDRDLIAACYPLHPSTLLVLPELCSRYGQNERTLFSFLSSPEPLSVLSFLTDADYPPLPWVRLDRVYDYFVESASTFVGVSRDASRWIEIETTIRDAHGLTDAQQRVLKTIGILNLIASSGTLRASRDLIEYACVDDRPGTTSPAEVQDRMEELEHTGLITYRDFAAEYRIWRGSDFDLNAALTIARRQVREQSLANILTDVLPLTPVVAARHTTDRATVRAFKRVYADTATTDLADHLPAHSSVNDGLLVYALEPIGLDPPDGDIPLVVVEPADHHPVVTAAIEVAALRHVAADPAVPADDRAIQRELAERTAYAQQTLDQTVAAAYNHTATWTWLNPPAGEPRTLSGGFGSKPLSDVLDEVYPPESSPAVRYEVINRSELTSAGARARRNVLEALVTPARRKQKVLGFEGEGSEVAVYHAVLGDFASGVHTATGDLVGDPAGVEGAWRPVWTHVRDEIHSSDDSLSVEALLDSMMAPPYGLREGTATVLLTALLVAEAHDLAIYEHGTFTPRFTADVSERMVRNPRNFAVKSLHTASRQSRRGQFLAALNDALDERRVSLRTDDTDTTVLTTVRRLVRAVHRPTNYLLKTVRFHGVDHPNVGLLASVRDALTTASEPDKLLFEALPAAVGGRPVRHGNKNGSATLSELAPTAGAIADAVATLTRTDSALADLIARTIIEHASKPTVRGRALEPADAVDQIRGHAVTLLDIDTLTPTVRMFSQHARHPSDPADPRDLRDWAVRIATGIADGTPPSDWADDDVPGYLRRVADVAATFQRTAMLASTRANQAGRGAFDAFAVIISDADGNPLISDVAALFEDDHAVDEALSAAFEQLIDVAGGRQDAIKAALAWLGNQARHDAAQTTTDNGRAAAHG